MSALLLGTVTVMAQEHGAERASQPAKVPQEYRAIFEAVTDGLVITDLATGRILEVNPAVCRMHGYQREELIGSPTTKLIHPGDHPLFTDFADAIQHGHEFRARRRDVTKDGRVFEVEVRGIRLPFRGRPHMLGVVRDITEEAAAYRLLEERVTSRTRELSGLLAVARRLAAVVGPADIQRTLREEAGGVLARSAFSVWRLEAGRLVPVTAGEGSQGVPLARLPRAAPLLEAGELVRSRGAGTNGELYTELADAGLVPAGALGVLFLPLVAAGELMGVLGVTRQGPPRYTPEEVSAAQALASQVAVALGNVALFRRAQAVASAETRQAIARDLHDSVSQTLFSVTLQVRAAQAALRKIGLGEDHPAAWALAEVSELNHGALAEMRALIFELRPGALAEEGLAAAVSKHAAAVAAREGIDVVVTGPADRLPLSPEAEEQLYRLTQEALNNVIKHARTMTASVAVTSGPAEVTVVIRDDGIGFDPSFGRPGHLGLASMRERVTRLGGRLDIASAPGAGTTITATIPAGLPPDQGGGT
jgi:PAS domain S-box-containing protein